MQGQKYQRFMRNLLQLSDQVLELRCFTYGIECRFRFCPVTYCAKTVIKCASQRQKCGVLVSQQRVGARTVVNSQRIVWLQLKNLPQCGLGFLLATKASIGFCQTTHHNYVVHTCLELSRSNFYNFERRVMGSFVFANFSIDTHQES